MCHDGDDLVPEVTVVAAHEAAAKAGCSLLKGLAVKNKADSAAWKYDRMWGSLLTMKDNEVIE